MEPTKTTTTKKTTKKKMQLPEVPQRTGPLSEALKTAIREACARETYVRFSVRSGVSLCAIRWALDGKSVRPATARLLALALVSA